MRSYIEDACCYCIFTGRNEVVAKVIFLHVCVILFRGGSPGRETPLGREIPSGTRPPPEQTPPTPRDQTPPRADTPPGSRLQHTVYERPVRILLECILVIIIHCLFFGQELLISLKHILRFCKLFFLYLRILVTQTWMH